MAHKKKAHSKKMSAHHEAHEMPEREKKQVKHLQKMAVSMARKDLKGKKHG